MKKETFTRKTKNVKIFSNYLCICKGIFAHQKRVTQTTNLSICDTSRQYEGAAVQQLRLRALNAHLEHALYHVIMILRQNNQFFKKETVL